MIAGMTRFHRALLAGVTLLAVSSGYAASLDPRFVVHVTPEMLRHQRILNTMYLVGFAYEILVLAVILASGLAARLRDLAERAVRWRFVQSMLFIVLLPLLTSATTIPIASYHAFIVTPHCPLPT